jgi:hypothetical protein
MRSERQRSGVTVSIVLVVAVLVAVGHAVGGEGKGEEYFQNAGKYFFDRGVPQSDTEAVRWYRKAAEQGHVDAQSRLRERGLTWAVRTPEQQEVPHVESPTPPSSPVTKQRAPTPSSPAAKKQVPAPTRSSKIPDDLGDLD